MDTTSRQCRSCGEKLTGKFCAACGEKVIDPAKDFSIRKFTEQVVDGFTHFDTKITNTFKALFFKPGRLTWNYIQGIRVKFMKPVQLFLVASVLFYFFNPASSSFYATFEEMKNGFEEPGFSFANPLKFDINRTLVYKARKKVGPDAPKEVLKQKAEDLYIQSMNKAASRSKTFLFLVLPFWALLIWGLFYRQQPFYVPHLIFTLHTLSFFLLLDMLFLIFYFDIIGVKVVNNTTHMLPFFLTVFLYVALALRKTYTVPVFQLVWKTILVIAALLFLLFSYRIFITTWVINTL